MPQLTQEIKNELKEMIYDFFSEECDVEKEELSDETKIIEDLDGDSLLFVELVELVKKKYGLDIQLQVIGKYLLKNPVVTIGQVIGTSCDIYQHENNIVSLSS